MPTKSEDPAGEKAEVGGQPTDQPLPEVQCMIPMHYTCPHMHILSLFPALCCRNELESQLRQVDRDLHQVHQQLAAFAPQHTMEQPPYGES